jgi:transglutaminase-like putative cysteine protease
MDAAGTTAPPPGEGIRLRVGCQFSYENGAPTPAVIQVAPRRDGACTVLEERWEITPEARLEPFTDLYGNQSQRTTLGEGAVSLRFDALVEVPGVADGVGEEAQPERVEELPAHVLHFLLASRYCVSDELMSTAWELFGASPPGWARAQAVCDWVHANLAFQYGSSDVLTTARQAYERRRGVCRDFAHLFIAFCRALTIPARYVFGYLPDILVDPPPEPMDFCAWTEVYLGGRWWTFDPRNNRPRVGRVVIGRGRDAVDVAMLTTWGPARFRDLVVWAEEDGS